MKNPKSGLFFSLVFLAAVILLAGCGALVSPLKISPHTPAFIQNGLHEGELPYWVDITGYSSRVSLLTNGREIYFWEPFKNLCGKMSRPPGIPWSPAGIAYDSKQKLLWVANSEAHNLLGLQVDLPNRSLILVKKIFHPLMVDPQNVAVSPDGQYLAAADYQGSALLCFDSTGDFVWRLPIFSARGLAGGGKYFYVASMERRQIKKVNREGDIVDCIGRPGWGADRYLQPGSLAVSGKGVLICDPHTGKLTLTNLELENERSLGEGNGPGSDLLNFPRRAIFDSDNNLLTLDTYNRRILRIRPSGEVIKQYCFSRVFPHGKEFRPVVGNQSFPNYIFPKQNLDELKTALPLAFKKKSYRYCMGFNSLDVFSGARDLICRLRVDYPLEAMKSFKLPELDYPNYLTWALPVKEYRIPFLVVGSPQSPYVTAVDAEEGVFEFQPCPSWIYGLWFYQGKVHGSDGKAVNMVKICYPFLKKADMFRRLLLRGTPREQAFKLVFYPQLTREEYFHRLDDLMPSFEGKEFLSAYREGKPLENAGREYFEQTRNQPTRWLLEICLVKALSGVKGGT